MGSSRVRGVAVEDVRHGDVFDDNSRKVEEHHSKEEVVHEEEDLFSDQDGDENSPPRSLNAKSAMLNSKKREKREYNYDNPK